MLRRSRSTGATGGAERVASGASIKFAGLHRQLQRYCACNFSAESSMANCGSSASGLSKLAVLVLCTLGLLAVWLPHSACPTTCVESSGLISSDANSDSGGAVGGEQMATQTFVHGPSQLQFLPQFLSAAEADRMHELGKLLLA
eukprot:SAG11_NODE_10604_length_817_cov_2.518106_1_plen_143_part_01